MNFLRQLENHGWAIALIALLLGLTACDAPSGPVVKLVTVQFNEASALQTTATFTMRLINEQPKPVTIEGAVYKIYINGLFVGEGLSNETLTLDRLSTTTTPVIVYLDNLALATRLKAIIETESFDYRVQSLFYGKDPAGKLHSTSDGRLALKDFQPTPAPVTATNAPAQP
jgi:LEA14-like dessication related protein